MSLVPETLYASKKKEKIVKLSQIIRSHAPLVPRGGLLTDWKLLKLLVPSSILVGFKEVDTLSIIFHSSKFHESFQIFKKKYRIRETKNLSTDADSSTDTTVGWTKNTPKPNFFEKRKKSSKTQKLKNY